MKRYLNFLIIFFILSLPIAFAQDTTTFQWDLSTSEPLGPGGGYHLYASKQSGSYTPADIIGTASEGGDTLIVNTSSLRGRYYFVATAFILDDKGTPETSDDEIVESAYSNEITAVFKPNPPTNLRKSE